MENQTEIIDLETFAKEGKEIPKKKKYQFKVNDEKYVTAEEVLLAEEILKIAGFNKKEVFLLKKVRGKFEYLCAKEKIDLTEPSIEKFKTEPIQNNLLLTILTTQGKWRILIARNQSVQVLIAQIVKHFGFSQNGQYEIRLKSDPNRPLDPNATLGSLDLEQCETLIFTDLGMAA